MAKKPKDDQVETGNEETAISAESAPRPSETDPQALTEDDRDAAGVPGNDDIGVAPSDTVTAPEGIVAGTPDVMDEDDASAVADVPPVARQLAAPVHDPRDEAGAEAASLGAEVEELMALDGTAPDDMASPAAVPPEMVNPDAQTPASPPSAATSPKAQTEVVNRHRFFPALLGGVVAAGLGFGLALVVLPDGLAGLPGQGGTTVKDDMATLQAEVAELKSSVAPVDLTGIEDRVETLGSGQSGLESSLSEATATLAALGDRVAALEDAPEDQGVAPEQIEGINDQVAALKQALDDQSAALKQEIESAAQQSELSAAMTELDAALDSGEAYEDSVATLSRLGMTVPDGLTANAAGVPTLNTLQQSFPDYARAALRATVDMGDTSSVMSFVKSQLGVRSLTPQEGDTTDAILSRAEAALRAGDLDTTLSELDSLPEEAKSPMQDWMDSAQTRAEAVGARSGLDAATQTN
ncbi:COG4223 family protein [Pseudooceanicola algae]|uniref:Uncharacterized protein n=1 Tax=Pseudooceanicola algae TaxID=1537215 RepID=A0A418SFP2_9RHOB|nr:mitofilin family membrane protein [Pseudooceanicola algae]QPM91526.1 hypothetical protein PSAL_027790 [Pseudooceanicola algae]